MSVISDIKMILESNSIHLLYDARLCTEQKERWDAIKNADLVEVIRCKDCRYWQEYQEGHYPNELCPWDKNETTDEDDYCSFGERREDDKG